jgi:hypothetical protein
MCEMCRIICEICEPSLEVGRKFNPIFCTSAPRSWTRLKFGLGTFSQSTVSLFIATSEGKRCISYGAIREEKLVYSVIRAVLL